MMQILRPAVLLVLWSHLLQAQLVTFGLFSPSSFDPGNTTIFLGRYNAGRFMPDTALSRLLQPFKPGLRLVGLNSKGCMLSFTIKNLVEREGDLGEGLLDLAPESIPPGLDSSDLDPVLLVPKGTLIQALALIGAQLPLGVDKELRISASKLFQNALRLREVEDSAAKLLLKPPLVQALAGVSDVLIVSYPATIVWSNNRLDDRAIAFFLYSVSRRQEIKAAFGHPEWAHVSEDVVLTVRPSVFFRLPPDPKVYFMGRHQLGWESNEYAIYELATGRALLTSR